jgi:hypothetical protein
MRKNLQIYDVLGILAASGNWASCHICRIWHGAQWPPATVGREHMVEVNRSGSRHVSIPYIYIFNCLALLVQSPAFATDVLCVNIWQSTKSRAQVMWQNCMWDANHMHLCWHRAACDLDYMFSTLVVYFPFLIQLRLPSPGIQCGFHLSATNMLPQW